MGFNAVPRRQTSGESAGGGRAADYEFARDAAPIAGLEELNKELGELDDKIKPLREELRKHEGKIDEIAGKLAPLLDKRSEIVQAIATKGGKSIS